MVVVDRCDCVVGRERRFRIDELAAIDVISSGV